ncbi:MAG: DNA polymerase III subunit alpha [Gammaproteobacteria bacterium]|nr:DNA polymerase III subunit alpha [Gammaproteobacteria bacterium]
MKPGFVHLSLHTEYSLVDSVIRIPALMQSLRSAGMPAVALTDQCNLFALIKFYRNAIAQGIKPLIGADLLVTDTSSTDAYRLRLLCQNNNGYRNLTELISRAYQEGQHSGQPQVQADWIAERSEGLLALSAGVQGNIGRALIAQRNTEAQQALHFWQKLFPERFYIELQRTGREHEENYINEAVQLASTHSVPVVASNDVRFLEASDFEAHETRVCIHEGRTLEDPRRPRCYSRQQYLRSAEEMAELFADLPEALTNTVEISKRCNLQLELGKSYLPAFPVPAGQSTETFFTDQSEQGLQHRVKQAEAITGEWSAERLQEYKLRLQQEIKVIIDMGFPGYFLIVADFIRWARANGVPVGPGRGSGAGSLVAYALGITDLDPIQYDLLFERFLNPERVSLPDFDVDFCMEGRDRVIEYVAERYGRDRVSQIITYGSMAAKAVVRDVGRVLGHPYGFVDNIAKLVPFEIGMTLDKALEESEDLRKAYESDEEVTALLDRARALEGLARNAGKHAGGVVIAPSKLTDFTPLYCEPDGQGLVTQLDKDDVEAIGLVKFDFLGLRTLTIINHAVETVNRRLQLQGQESIAIETIPLNDEKTFALLKAQLTTAVFQLESRGMKDLIKRLQPDNFEEIIALVALFRPGPLQSGMVDDFIARKHGEATIHYAHPALEPILKSTYGVILYQEQVMQIGQVLAGYSLGGADLLRRAMGKKKPEEMAKQRKYFLRGSAKNKVEEKTASYIFDLMEKFAGYGFNKSHSAAYALLSYQTAWLKAHYPPEFMSAVLSADMDNTDKVVRLIDECQQLHIKVVPPNVNRSDYVFSVDEQGRIVYGLGAIKGVGAAAIEVMQRERESYGLFKDLFDFCRRLDGHKVNKRALEALVKAGALDELQHNRATLMHNLPAAIKVAEQDQRNRSAGQVDIFGATLGEQSLIKSELVQQPEWDEEQRLTAEKESLGLYLTGHPINRYKKELLQITGKNIADSLDWYESRKVNTTQRNGVAELEVVLAGLVVDLRSKNTRAGKMAFAVLDDRSARVDVMVRPEDYDRFATILVKDKVVVVEGGLAADDFSGGYRVRAKNLYDIEQAREAFGRGLEICVSDNESGNGFLEKLESTLNQYRPGQCPVWVQYHDKQASTRLYLGEEWKVQPSEQLLQRLQTLLGPEQVRLVYQNGRSIAEAQSA